MIECLANILAVHLLPKPARVGNAIAAAKNSDSLGPGGHVGERPLQRAKQLTKRYF